MHIRIIAQDKQNKKTLNFNDYVTELTFESKYVKRISHPKTSGLLVVYKFTRGILTLAMHQVDTFRSEYTRKCQHNNNKSSLNQSS